MQATPDGTLLPHQMICSPDEARYVHAPAYISLRSFMSESRYTSPVPRIVCSPLSSTCAAGAPHSSKEIRAMLAEVRLSRAQLRPFARDQPACPSQPHLPVSLDQQAQNLTKSRSAL